MKQQEREALPPLPGAACHGFVGEDTEDLFTADQMHAYARAALAAKPAQAQQADRSGNG